MDYLHISDDRGVTITKYVGENSLAVVPNQIDGKPVLKIGEYAFSDNCFIKAITIEAKLVEICGFAFQFCDELETINLPDSLKYIGESAFEGCVKLKSILIPPIDRINKSTFEECCALTFVEIPRTVQLIDERAFEFCLNLREVKMYEGLREIRNGAFFCCRRLKTFYMPDTVIKTGKEILLGCRKLEEVHLSKSLEKIEVGLLARCRELRAIEIPDSVKVICNGAFAECSVCNSFVLKDKNIRIGVRVFEGCMRLLEDHDFVDTMKRHLENKKGRNRNMERGNLYTKRDKSLRDRFGDVAEKYEEYRFEYPDKLFDDIFVFASSGRRALEVGIGTGKATLSFLEKGYDVVAVEPVKNMLEIAKRKFCNKTISFINSTFEDLDLKEKFDLIYAASSFQWINGCDRLGKVYELLQNGGAFARFKTVNIIDNDKHTNNAILTKAYQKFLPDFLPIDVHKKHIR